MDEKFQAICGITEEELYSYFDEGVTLMADRQEVTKDECYAELKDLYDGYHFVPNGVGLYNPFSLLNALDSKAFGFYWFETGTPTRLLVALRETKADLSSVSGVVVDARMLKNINSYEEDLIALLYQSGYLTISKSIDAHFVELDFPNGEVRHGYMQQLLPLYSNMNPMESSTKAGMMKLLLIKGNVNGYIAQMQSLISSISYRFFKSNEAVYQFIFLVTGELVGMKDLRTEVEKETNKGRIDMCLETKDYIYIFEFKHDGSPEEALAQIHEKGYAEQFKTDPRKKFLIGVNFSSELRNIPDDGWKVEEIG